MQVSPTAPILSLCLSLPLFWTRQSTNNIIIISKATLCYVREKIIIAILVVYSSDGYLLGKIWTRHAYNILKIRRLGCQKSLLVGLNFFQWKWRKNFFTKKELIQI